jgi:antitoxin component of RelBE/YafQ-DinJ toxin-antitoxin module
MDAKITLSFDAEVISNAKQYAEQHGISLSRLTEILLRKLVSGQYGHIEEFPVADWVTMAAEGEAEYISRPRSNKKLRVAYRERK